MVVGDVGGGGGVGVGPGGDGVGGEGVGGEGPGPPLQLMVCPALTASAVFAWGFAHVVKSAPEHPVPVRCKENPTGVDVVSETPTSVDVNPEASPSVATMVPS